MAQMPVFLSAIACGVDVASWLSHVATVQAVTSAPEPPSRYYNAEGHSLDAQYPTLWLTAPRSPSLKTSTMRPYGLRTLLFNAV